MPKIEKNCIKLKKNWAKMDLWVYFLSIIYIEGEKVIYYYGLK